MTPHEHFNKYVVRDTHFPVSHLGAPFAGRWFDENGVLRFEPPPSDWLNYQKPHNAVEVEYRFG